MPDVDAGQPPPETSKLNIDPNMASALCYLFGCLSGILFFLLETDNRRIRFHALQSILLFSTLAVLMIGSIFMMIFTNVAIFRFLNGLIGIAQFALWIIMVIRTFQGHTIKLPVIGDFAQKTVGWP